MEQFYNILGHLKFSDFVDIFIVSIIIYQFLTIIRGTRAVQMMLGIAALFILFGLSVRYRFYALNWVLSHFFDSFFLILVILFQDHIRSALVNVGAVNPLLKRKSDGKQNEIEEVVEAVNALSKEKTGALIVFERKNGLLNYSQTGTTLYSEIHSDIIYTLFQNNSPLHDGAIILGNNKIKAAGCFLPLSKSLELDKKFGTRHRAAIGVTEGTDALVVTVSEESGKINLCKSGSYYPIKDASELKLSLYKNLKS